MRQPDILFIVLDTQRADRLGCYGAAGDPRPRSLTPNLDAFAAQGATFEQAVAPAQWTIPSHASMFTGLYPTAHQVTQSSQSLSHDGPHLVEALCAAGYQTIGFCNNPLVGVLNNGFKRGFDRFYNYGGAFPSTPESSARLPRPFGQLLEAYTQFLRRLSYPIQNFFGRSDLAFRVSLNPWLTPLWSNFAHFKGQNERSVRDLGELVRRREAGRDAGRPLFLFLNLMETHLPFWPPGDFVARHAPTLLESREARDALRRWNREAGRWGAPLAEPFSDLEAGVLNGMYDAEVAYQDDYLGALFQLLAGRARAADTLTLIVADHGEGLGEHGYFGHAFVAYQELVHVPLILHWPGRIAAGGRVQTPVSTRRVYHTLLAAAGASAELRSLSLLEEVAGHAVEAGRVLSEVFPPLNFLRAVQHRQPELLERFRCLATRRAFYEDGLKLVEVDGAAEELYALAADPLEQENVVAQRPAEVAGLEATLRALLRTAEAQREGFSAGAGVAAPAEESLLRRLRGLGYIE
ncbi:MAG: sulfatase [Candidatus Promineifilaceae bacterium]